MELTKLILIVVLVLAVLALVLSGKFRTLCKAFFNLFVEDLAATPEGAEALFNQKEEEVKDKYRKADDVFKKVVGQKKRCEDELAALTKQLTKLEADCEALAKMGDENGLTIKINERADVLEDIELHKESLGTLSAAYTDASEMRAACEENLNQIQKKRKQVVAQMKRNRDMKAIYDDLEGIGANDHTSKLLDRVIEKGTDLDDMVAGSKASYESKTSTQSKKVDQRLKSSSNDEYKKMLMNKYKNNGGN